MGVPASWITISRGNVLVEGLGQCSYPTFQAFASGSTAIASVIPMIEKVEYFIAVPITKERGTFFIIQRIFIIIKKV